MKSSKDTEIERITVGELIRHLEVFDKDSEVIFGSDDLTFYRTKGRGPKLVQIEFNEVINNGKIVKLD